MASSNGIPRTAWFWCLVAGGAFAASAGFLDITVANTLAGFVLVAAGVAVVAGIRRQRPASAGPWWFFVAGLLAVALGQVTLVVFAMAGYQPGAVSAADFFFMAQPPLIAAGLAIMVWRRPVRPQWQDALDMAIVAVGLSPISWIWIIDPYVDSGFGPFVLIAGLTGPLGVLLAVAMAARLQFTTKERRPSFVLLLGSLIVSLFAASGRDFAVVHRLPTMGETAGAVGWMASGVLLAAAALHPSMERTDELARSHFPAVSTARLGLFAVLGVLAPVLALAEIGNRDRVETVVFVAVVPAAMVVLLTLRLGQIAKLAQARAADLTRSREELRAAHQRVSAMFRSAPTGMIQLDAGGRVLAVNPAFSEFAGTPVQELVDRTIAEFVASDDVPRVVALVAEVLRDHDVQNRIEVCFVHPDGDPRYGEVVASPVSEGGEPDAVIVVVMDRTHARRLEVELRHAQKLEGIGRLAAGVAHEINTPIQFVGDNVDFLADAAIRLMNAYRTASRPGVDRDTLTALDAKLEIDYLADEMPEAVRQTTDGVRRIATIVQALKSFAHPSTPVHVPADLNQAITDTLTVARSQLANVAGLRIELGELPPVLCSVGDLNQVFLNLLINAADAVADVREPVITVSSRSERDEVVIEFSDNGCGIPEDHQAKIFEPFFTTKPVGKGTGQGLALARALVVDRHGGTITCTSTPGEGTTFTVRLRP